MLGRSGRIDLDTRPFENSNQSDLRSIVWSHLAHKSELEGSIDDAIQLCQTRPKRGRDRARLIWMGDFNIDPLRDRDQEWLRLQEALNGTGLVRSEPRFMEADPKFHCTRRPNGDQGGVLVLSTMPLFRGGRKRTLSFVGKGSRGIMLLWP